MSKVVIEYVNDVVTIVESGIPGPAGPRNIIQESGGPTTLAVGAVADGEYLRRVGSAVVGGTPAGGGSTPTGTGLPHIVAGVQQAAASLIVNADVDAAAAIAFSKLAGVASSAQGALADTATQPATLASAIATHVALPDPHPLYALESALGTAAAQNVGAFEAAGAVSTHNAVTTAHGISAFGATLVDDADASAARTTLGLGTAAQSATGDFAAASHNHAASAITSGTLVHERGGLEADVSAYSGLVKIAAGATSAVTVTAAGEALLDDADATAQLATLGGTAPTGAGAVVRATSPTLVTPTLGAASATSLTLTTDLAIADGGTGQSTAQAAIDALTAVAAATNEHVLTKDTTTGNAIFKAAAGGSPAGSGTEIQYRNGSAFGAIAGTSWASNQLLIQAQAAATVPLAIRAAASHTAAIQEWQNSAGTALLRIDSGGIPRSGNGYYGSAGSAGLMFQSGFTTLKGFDNKDGLAINASTGVACAPHGLALGPNYFTPDCTFYRIAAGIFGVRATSTSTGAAVEFLEQTAPSAASANGVRIYAEDNGSGKTRLMALFATGAAQQIAIEP